MSDFTSDPMVVSAVNAITPINELVVADSALAEPPLRVISLHDLYYCERLFYFTEVEDIQNPNSLMYAGRRLHDDIVPLDDETPERRSVEVSSEALGLFGKVDAMRRRDGRWVALEHKRGRCWRDDQNQVRAWPSDRIQAIAYAVLLAENLGEPVPQARVRYHADNVTALIEIDAAARAELQGAVLRARELRRTTQRPPVCENERLCRRCSLAPICLPEEERLATRFAFDASEAMAAELVADDADSPLEKLPFQASGSTAASLSTPTLHPSHRERHTLHLTANRTSVGRSGESLLVSIEDEETRQTKKEKVPIAQIDALVIHGYGQVTTQAIHLCASRGVAVQWLTNGGKYAAGISASPGRVQQRLRQYGALSEPETRLRLARKLVLAKVETQLRYILRATRGSASQRIAAAECISRIRQVLATAAKVTSVESLLGCEGMAAKAYFAALPHFLVEGVPAELRPCGRTKHPPRDRFNALLSFGYALTQTTVHRAALAVGLEPAFGFYHQPRTAAPPLVLDVMELFRTVLCEMPMIGSINRLQWNIAEDFSISPGQVWLSDTGRKKAIQIFEQRLEESYKHPHTGQSLSYARMVELELRLLEKEWTGAPGLFGNFRLR